MEPKGGTPESGLKTELAFFQCQSKHKKNSSFRNNRPTKYFALTFWRKCHSFTIKAGPEKKIHEFFSQIGM